MKTVNVSIEGASPLSPRARKTRQSQERQGMERRGQAGMAWNFWPRLYRREDQHG